MITERKEIRTAQVSCTLSPTRWTTWTQLNKSDRSRGNMGTCWEGHSKQGLGHGSSSTDTRPRPVMPDSSARCQPTVTSQDIPQEGHETFQLWGWGYIVSLWSHVKQLQLPMSLRARDHQATENWMFRAYSNTHTQLTYSTHIHTYTHTHIHTY